MIGTPTSAAGISGFLINGQSYRLDFVYDTYENLFGISVPPFARTDSAFNTTADAIADSLAATLNAFGVTRIDGNPSNGADDLIALVIPSNPIIHSGVGDYFTGFHVLYNWPDGTTTWLNDGPLIPAIDRTYDRNSIVVFTAEMPIPGALPLFASGLGMLGLAAWRRSRHPRCSVQ